MMTALKIVHILSVISWMAGLLYLPRLFVYHAEQPPGSSTSATFKIMERRLYRFIMTPAAWLTWISGLALALSFFDLRAPWLIGKIVLVVALTLHHGFQGHWLARFARDQNTRPGRFFRIQNEVPTLLMIGIVILVVAKPF
jgi:protoporphyrinogen IX oxidase